MTPRDKYIRKNLVKSFCIIAPDSSVILDYAFMEKGFKIKVDYLIKDIQSIGITCEILPKVITEITKKLVFAAESYMRILRRCKFLVSKFLGSPLNQVEVEKNIVTIIEKSFSGLIEEIERKRYPQFRQKIKELNVARIIETAVMLELRQTLLESEEISLEDFFNRLEDKFEEKYEEFNNSVNSLFEAIKAEKICKDKIPEPSEKLRKILRKKCEVNELPDVDLLCEAISRMYSTNKWYAIVSTDYGIVNNREAIDKFTLLTVSDPLYVFFHIDQKVDLALNPIEGAKRQGIPYQMFIKSFIPPGVA